MIVFVYIYTCTRVKGSDGSSGLTQHNNCIKNNVYFFSRINKMRESGLLKKWTTEWTPSNLQCVGLGPITTATEASLNDFQGAFYLLIIGITLSCILLITELVYSYRTRYALDAEDTLPVVGAEVMLGHSKRSALDDEKKAASKIEIVKRGFMSYTNF